MNDKKDSKDKKASKPKKKGFFGKLLGGSDDDPPEDVPSATTPSSVQAKLAAGPAEKVLGALRDGDVKALRSALLSFGSATPDNTKAVDKIRLVNGEIRVGAHPLADILHRSEGSHRPRQVRDDMGIDRETWEASCRLTTLLVQALGAATKTE